jgi:2-C-methyl-D-erythritol 4-phosphate cytidylyltransferase
VLKTAVIVAGGSGKRMQTNIPKQFLILNNKPVLFYSLNSFHSFDPDTDIIIVLPEKHISTWKSMVSEYEIRVPHKVVAGGPTRFHSVKSGLKICSNIQENHVVAIHDGVRPLVDLSVIREGYAIALRKGSAIPVVSVNETLREVNGSFSKIVPREKFCLVQTPQFFQCSLIRECYTIQYSETFSDDAGVFEASGRQVTLIDGNPENIKITTASDLTIASALLSQKGF